MAFFESGVRRRAAKVGKSRDFYLFWGSRVARFRFRRVFAAVVWSEKDRLSVFPQKKQKKINFALKKIDFFFGIYYTLKRTAKIAAKFVADMAQVVERVLGKDEVPGSSPGISSSKKRICNLQVRFFCVKKAGGYSKVRGGLYPKDDSRRKRSAARKTCRQFSGPHRKPYGHRKLPTVFGLKGAPAESVLQHGKTSPLRRGEGREKRDCLSRPGKKTDPLSQGRAGGFLRAIAFRDSPRCRVVPRDRRPEPRKGWQTCRARASCPL